MFRRLSNYFAPYWTDVIETTQFRAQTPEVRAMGVAEVFPIETPVERIVTFLQENVKL